jgi:hypothetical protein
MKPLSYTAVVLLMLTLAACSKKVQESEAVPPGFCKTEAECQPMADRENARQEELRQKRIAQGVHDQYHAAPTSPRRPRTTTGTSRGTRPGALPPRANKTRIPILAKPSS